MHRQIHPWVKGKGRPKESSSLTQPQDSHGRTLTFYTHLDTYWQVASTKYAMLRTLNA